MNELIHIVVVNKVQPDEGSVHVSHNPGRQLAKITDDLLP